MTTIVVTGAAGGLGRVLVPRLVQAGYAVRGMSRRPRPDQENLAWVQADLVTGEGLAAATANADILIHCASDATSQARETDVEGTKKLLAAASHLSHFFYISIVGVDQLPLPYYQYKYQAEQAIEQSGVPYTILRATQFHNFLDLLLGMFTRWPVAFLPLNFRVQPIDVDEVAEHMVELVGQGPRGRVPDIGGPETLTVRQLLPPWLKATNRRRLILPLPLPGKVAAGYRQGLNTTPNRLGRVTWAQWLTQKYGGEA